MIQLKNNPPKKKKVVLALQPGSFHSTAELTLLRRWQIAFQKWQLQLPAVVTRQSYHVTAPRCPLDRGAASSFAAQRRPSFLFCSTCPMGNNKFSALRNLFA